MTRIGSRRLSVRNQLLFRVAQRCCCFGHSGLKSGPNQPRTTVEYYVVRTQLYILSSELSELNERELGIVFPKFPPGIHQSGQTKQVLRSKDSAQLDEHWGAGHYLRNIMPPIINRYTVVSESTYEDRWVAFIDILGWKNFVESSITNQTSIGVATEMFRKIRTSIDYSRSIEQVTHENYWPRFAAISDSIIVTFPATFSATLFFEQVCYIQRLLLLYGFLCRGAITLGKMHHSESAAFGPALTKSYLLEQKAAKYARVIIDPDIYKEFENISGYTELVDNFSWVEQLGLVCVDRDGHLITNFLLERFEAPYQYEVMSLDQIRSFLVDVLQALPMTGAPYEKVYWLATYFDKLVDKFQPEGLRKIISN